MDDDHRHRGRLGVMDEGQGTAALAAGHRRRKMAGCPANPMADPERRADPALMNRFAGGI